MKVGSGIKAILGEYITDKRVVEECEGKVVGHIDSLLRIKEREILEEMRVRCVEAISKMSEEEIEALGYVKIEDDGK